MISQKLRSMNVALWIVQWIVAVLMLSGAVMKLLPIERMAPIMPWMGQVPEYTVRILAFIDLAGAIGILIPSLLGRKKHLTVLAAGVIVLLMLSAIVFHVSRGELPSIGINVFTGTLALFIGLGRMYEMNANRSKLRFC